MALRKLRFQMIADGPRLTLHFTYENYDPPEDTLVVNLETGMDEKNHTPVSSVELKQPA